jgi:hypothetical protein
VPVPLVLPAPEPVLPVPPVVSPPEEPDDPEEPDEEPDDPEVPDEPDEPPYVSVLLPDEPVPPVELPPIEPDEPDEPVELDPEVSVLEEPVPPEVDDPEVSEPEEPLPPDVDEPVPPVDEPPMEPLDPVEPDPDVSLLVSVLLRLRWAFFFFFVCVCVELVSELPDPDFIVSELPESVVVEPEPTEPVLPESVVLPVPVLPAPVLPVPELPELPPKSLLPLLLDPVLPELEPEPIDPELPVPLDPVPLVSLLVPDEPVPVFVSLLLPDEPVPPDDVSLDEPVPPVEEPVLEEPVPPVLEEPVPLVPEDPPRSVLLCPEPVDPGVEVLLPDELPLEPVLPDAPLLWAYAPPVISIAPAMIAASLFTMSCSPRLGPSPGQGCAASRARHRPPPGRSPPAASGVSPRHGLACVDESCARPGESQERAERRRREGAGTPSPADRRVRAPPSKLRLPRPSPGDASRRAGLRALAARVSSRSVNGIDPADLLGRLGGVEVQVHDDGVRVAPHQQAPERLGRARVHLLVRDVGRHVDEVARSGLGRELEPVAPAHPRAPADDVDHALERAVVVRAGPCARVDGDGPGPQLLRADPGPRHRRGAGHPRRLRGVRIERVPGDHPDAVVAPPRLVAAAHRRPPRSL